MSTPPTPLWNLTAVATHLGVTRWTINHWMRTDPTFPQPIRLTPKTPRWRPEDVESWLRSKVTEALPAPARTVKVPTVRAAR